VRPVREHRSDVVRSFNQCEETTMSLLMLCSIMFVLTGGYSHRADSQFEETTVVIVEKSMPHRAFRGEL